MRRARTGIGICGLIGLMAVALAAQDGSLTDVTAISLEDLMNLKITSVSKREQKLSEAAAAVFVITPEDIRRSGARNIPEALRLAPGVEVARIDENKWAITARGFNGRFANKLLVLIDGRSVYTPLFSGVFWNVQDVLLDDVDRIEVIRGPGATLWGANAVNGVINIITRDARDTQGGLISAQAGDELAGQGSARYGDRIGDAAHYRAYLKSFRWNSSTDFSGSDAFDGWGATRGGFRIDADPSPEHSFTLQGDVYKGDSGETLTQPKLTAPYSSTFRNEANFSGGNVLGRWMHSSARSSTSLQLYFDRTNSAWDSLLVDRQSTYDIDFQRDLRIAEGHELIWGAGYRRTQDATEPSDQISFTPARRSLDLFSAFAQDEFRLFDQRLHVTLGSKFEYSGLTGFGFEPNALFLWNRGDHHSLWGAVSRALRTPSRASVDLRLNAAVTPPSARSANLPVLAAIIGAEDSQSERVTAFEAGYRVQAGGRFTADLATFYNVYDNLFAAEPGQPVLEMVPAPMHLLVPAVVDYKTRGVTYGAELFSEWKPVPMWRLSGAFNVLRMNIRSSPNSQVGGDPGQSSPQHQYYLRSSLDIGHRFEQDVTLRYVGRLKGLNIPQYYSLDARLGWKVSKNVEIAISGQNLIGDKRLEFRASPIETSPTQVKRTLQLGWTWKF